MYNLAITSSGNSRPELERRMNQALRVADEWAHRNAEKPHGFTWRCENSKKQKDQISGDYDRRKI